MLVKDSIIPDAISTFEDKILFIKQNIDAMTSPADKYNFIIDLGKSFPKLDEKMRTEQFLVRGCQSQLYLSAKLLEGKLFFDFFSDSLISAGLAALLVYTYSGLSPNAILKSPPDFLKDLGIFAALSPNRSQGLAYIYLKIRHFATLYAH